MSTAAPLKAKLCRLYPALQALGDVALDPLLAQAQRVSVPAGSLLFDERSPCQAFPLILVGAIRVAKCAASGRELPLYRVTPGETCIITSACLLGRADYNARGMAEGETEMVLLPRAAFLALIEQPQFRDFVFQLFSQRIAELMQLVEEVAFRKLDQRLAAALLGRGRRVHITHQQLADELGSVREIVSRLLKSFAEQGLVAMGREQLEILDPAGLRRVAEADRQ